MRDDGDGYANLKNVDLLVSPASSGANTIWVRYERNLNTLYLYNDTGNAP